MGLFYGRLKILEMGRCIVDVPLYYAPPQQDESLERVPETAGKFTEIKTCK
jgi:hypothetical protein